MSAFPRLKTGALAQYPAARTAGHATDVFQFLDGSEQKYRQQGRARKAWVIELELLDDTEMAELAGFFESQQGRFGSFSFVDPWTGETHADCSFDDDEIALQLTGEGRGTVRLVIKEN